jgi:predicted membrane protein
LLHIGRFENRADNIFSIELVGTDHICLSCMSGSVYSRRFRYAYHMARAFMARRRTINGAFTILVIVRGIVFIITGMIAIIKKDRGRIRVRRNEHERRKQHNETHKKG